MPKSFPWTNTAEKHAYMAKRQAQNRTRCVSNRNENWMLSLLESTGLKWTRQAQWGFRLFDFWNAEKGIAIEVDGPEHRKAYDQRRDGYNHTRSGIIVIRVRNMNQEDANRALGIILQTSPWKERRSELGLNTAQGKHAARKAAVAAYSVLPEQPTLF